MRGNHVAALVLLAVLAVIAVWWASPADPGLGRPEVAPAPAPAAAVAATLDGEPGRVGAGLPTVAESAAANAVVAPAGPTGRLQVRVRSERGDALAGCRVTAAEHEGTTDRDGAVAFALPAVRTFVSVDAPAGQALLPRSGWQTVRAGETTELVLVLAAPANVLFWCQLVAAEDGRALPGVVVREQPGNREHRSDAEGYLQVAVGDEFGFLDVEATGRAPCRILPSVDHATREQALRVPVGVGGTLRVDFADAAGAGVADVGVAVSAPPWRLQQPPYGSARGFEFFWRTESDAAGQLAITGLPIGVPLEVAVGLPAGFAAVATQRWTLSMPQERRLVVLAPAASVHGRAIDEAGRPVAGVPVQANVAAGDRVPRALGEAPAASSTTAADGTFRLEGLAPGRWWVGIPAGLAFQPVSHGIEVPIGGNVEVELVARAGLPLGGVAVGADGGPCGGAIVNLRLDEQLVGHAATDAQGRFHFQGLPPGPCQLSTNAFEDDLGLPEPRLVEAGDERIELRLVPMFGRLAGRCVGSPDMWVTAYRRDGGDVFGSRCDLDGSFVFVGLRAGTWDLTAFDRQLGAAWAAAVQVLPGRETGGVLLELQPGGVVRPRHPQADAFVVCRGEHVVASEDLEPGRPGEARVPAGAWTVVFRHRGREVQRRDVTMRAGEACVVDGGS